MTTEGNSLGEVFYEGKVGTVKGKNADGLTEALATMGVTLRYNLRAQSLELRHDSNPWVRMNDRIGAKLREVFAERWTYTNKDGGESPLKFGRDSWQDALNVIAFDTETDPFTDWLESLPAWDKENRLDGWITRLFHVTDRFELAEWASRFVLLGAVWRAYEPGTKLDEMPVLIGKGGIGKSTCLRSIIPPQHSDWFSDGLHLAADDKVKSEALQGRVIVEAAEMAGSTRAELEMLKSFLSRTDDGAVRLAYRRDPELSLRRCVMVGTSDRDNPLPNDRNLRRFVPVYLDEGNVGYVREYLDEHRVQLWAEAKSMYQDGVEARLPEKLMPMQGEATAQARSRDTLIEDAISDWVSGRDGFTMADVAFGINLIDALDKGARVRMADQHRIGGVLESMGYAKRRVMVNGIQAWRWYENV